MGHTDSLVAHHVQHGERVVETRHGQVFLAKHNLRIGLLFDHPEVAVKAVRVSAPHRTHERLTTILVREKHGLIVVVLILKRVTLERWAVVQTGRHQFAAHNVRRVESRGFVIPNQIPFGVNGPKERVG